MAAPELRRVRRQEALDAAELLGVTSDHVHFLDFPDGRLAGSHVAAVGEVSALLDRIRPEEVFVPYLTTRTAPQITRRPIEPLQSRYIIWAWSPAFTSIQYGSGINGHGFR